ncbi:MAG TPA: TlpA disulfide reductase family protein [Actinomycetales bacterium]|jgi:peroxiredoxin|nr:TlpA disulfide reductase family protein [Actinomycetales bacterium]
MQHQHRRPTRRTAGLRAAAAAALAAVLALSACSTAPELEKQARAGDNKNYVAGDGSVVEVAASDRGEPVEVTGTSAEGKPVDLTKWRGDVVVLNVWYAACGPCRAEAPDLRDIANKYAADGVRFVGVNTRDDAKTAQAFQRRFEIPYPSIIDSDGAAIIALRGQVSPQAVPTTLVIDKEGRVAARILGIADPSVLRSLVDDALA